MKTIERPPKKIKVMREIVIDAETTGLNPDQGHRVVEIGMVELVNHRPTGRTYQQYFNPERAMPKDAVAVHGITDEFLRDKPRFSAIASDVLAFIGDAPLVAHNAKFDRAFLNLELEKCGLPIVAEDRWIDTLALARGTPTLDDLCRCFGINANRDKHGALVDAELLAKVYLELVEVRQSSIDFMAPDLVEIVDKPAAQRPKPLPRALTAEDIAAHRAFISSDAFKERPIWFDYL
jgi:DNA polymerase-3 subunit epsilon